jgi:hypothetical protein
MACYLDDQEAKKVHTDLMKILKNGKYAEEWLLCGETTLRTEEERRPFF